LNAGVHQLEPHVDCECDRDETDKGRDDQVQDTDVFVVGGHEPTGKEPAFIMVILALNGCVCHADAS
jgi:hypothetical protein